MGRQQMTEMLKGTLEGIVLAILSVRSAYGYEITARLREQGFGHIAEGTVYALLVRFEQRGFVDVEKIPSDKGPPRKVYSLNAEGQEYLEEFWSTWSFLTDDSNSFTAEADRQGHRKGDWREAAMGAVQGTHAAASGELSDGGRGTRTVPDALRAGGRRRRSGRDVRRPPRPVRAERGEWNADTRDRRGRACGVPRDVRSELAGTGTGGSRSRSG